MSFMKGVMIGSLITAGAMFLYSGSIDDGKRRMVKKGRQFVKKMGII